MEEIQDKNLLIKKEENSSNWFKRIGITPEYCSQWGDAHYAYLKIFKSESEQEHYLANFAAGEDLPMEYVFLPSYPDLLGFLNITLPIINHSYQIEAFRHILNPHGTSDELAENLVEIIRQIKEEQE